MARATVQAAEEIVDRYFPVLDHGFVALVDYMGDDQAIVDGARTSYGLGTKAVRSDEGLLRYLYRNRHTTPIEMVELKFHCKMPIVVARQWIRHRTANVNEYSGRYSLMPMQFYTPKREQVTTQSTTNKQGRSDNLLEVEAYNEFVELLEEQRAQGQVIYEYALKQDVAREIARIELPLTMYTEWYWKIDLHNLLHFLGLRCHAHAQWEVREYANIMAGMVKRVAPLTFQAFLDYHPNMGGVLLSAQEIMVLRQLIASELGAVATRTGTFASSQSVTGEQMKNSGMSAREITALLELFNPRASRTLPSFELDLSLAKNGSYYEEEKKKYVPKIDG